MYVHTLEHTFPVTPPCSRYSPPSQYCLLTDDMQKGLRPRRSVRQAMAHGMLHVCRRHTTP
jgi:hypothetical protein